MLHLIERVGPSDSTVLITGETGSGKERVAKLIHARSTRKAKPFVVVDCAALQDSLLQSELFGHERGAFTSADRAKPGLFEVAHGGTIFLDEIGEISQATQMNLLRVLDTSAFRHVGGTSEIRVDVRVLAATNRDLEAMVRKQQFREDLYYRMSTIAVEIPPLRKRGSDIELLARHFVGVLNERFGSNRSIGEARWPRCGSTTGRATCASCCTRSKPPWWSAKVTRSSPDTCRPPPAPPLAAPAESGCLPSLDELERAHIRRVLEATGGHRGNAARILGISERNLYRKLHDHGLLP